jgi:hypothetical protein
MEGFVELMQRLLEIQRDETQGSSRLIAEDRQLIDGLRKRILAGECSRKVDLNQDRRERA